MIGLTKSNYTLIVLGWLITVIGASSMLRGCNSTTEAAPEEELLQYVFGHDGAARFRVGEMVSEIQLSTHLESPDTRSESEIPTTGPDTYLYGITAQFESDGAETIERTFWIRSKSSDNTEGLPLWTSDAPSSVVTDTRTITFNLDETIPNGGTITISPIIREDQRVLFRIEKRLEYSQDNQPSSESSARRASRWTPFDAGSITPVEIEQITSSSLRPLGAEWLNGNTTELYRTGLPGSNQDAPRHGFTLMPSQGSSVTLRGPCNIGVTSSPVYDLVDGAAFDDIEPELTVLRRGASGGTISPQTIEVPDGALWRLDWVLPPEAEARNISISTVTGGACLWGEPTIHSPTEDTEHYVLPETRRLTSYRLTDSGDKLRVEVASGRRSGVLNVEARAADDAVIYYEVLDSNGQEISTGRFVTNGDQDPFSIQVEPTRGPVYEATKFRIVHPYRATHISFTSDSQVDLRFLAEVQTEPLRASSYELPKGWRAANAPWDMAPYISLVPQDLEEILVEQRLVRFDSIVQPVRRETSRPEGLCESHTVTPVSPPQGFVIYEEARGQTDEWRQWDRSRIEGQVQIKIPSNGELKIDYRFYSEPPESLTLLCGDVSDTETVSASAGLFKFEGFNSGWQNCRFLEADTVATSSLFLARAEGSSRRWAQRRVYPIDSLRPQTVELTVPQGGTTLYARLYQPDSNQGQRPGPVVSVDNGRPDIRTGLAEHPTTATRNVSVSGTGRRALLSDAADLPLTPLQGIAVTLGDDLNPGNHQVTLSLNGEGFSGYVRFDSCAGTPREQGPSDRYWWREVTP